MLLLLTVQQAAARWCPVPRAVGWGHTLHSPGCQVAGLSQEDAFVHLIPQRLSMRPLTAPMAPHHPVLTGFQGHSGDYLATLAKYSSDQGQSQDPSKCGWGGRRVQR